MANIPAIDKFFNLEEALRAYGFEIDEKENSCVAYGYSYGKYGRIWVEFYTVFMDNEHSLPIDMRIFHYVDEGQENLYKGLAPTNQHDFETLLQLLFPSDAFIDRIEGDIQEREWIHANM